MMPSTDLTAGEVFDSLTGHDEMAITQHFGRTISDLTDDPSMWGRALVFVLRRRDGVNDDDARNEALAMTLKGATSYFAEEPAAESESGKGEPVSETPVEAPPAPSLSSVI
jgi:hypothetical protein